MKTNVLIIIFSVLIGATGCMNERGCTNASAINFNSSANIDNGSCLYVGSVTFWNAPYSGLGIVDVYVGGAFQGSITKNASSEPNCGQYGCVTFTGAPGSYVYEAYETSGKQLTWSGTIVVTSAGCSSFQLY